MKLRIDGRNGWLDRTVIMPEGKGFIMIELKRPGGAKRIAQEIWMRKLRAMGYIAERFDNFEDAKKLLDDALRAT